MTNFSLDTIRNLQSEIYDSSLAKDTLQLALQEMMNVIYIHLGDSIVLCRIFHLIRMGDLPDFEQQFVYEFANKIGIDSDLDNDTNILCLMGTKGQKQAWNNRKLSQGHLGIPIISAEFLSSIPMMVNLLASIGVKIPNVADFKRLDVAQPFQNQGAFVVEDALKAIDSQNRKVIADQHFVRNYGVKSVIGFGNQHVVHETFSVAVFFLRDSIQKSNYKIALFHNLLNITLGRIANHFLNKESIF